MCSLLLLINFLNDVVGEKKAILNVCVKVCMIPVVCLTYDCPLLHKMTKEALNHHSLFIKDVIVLDVLWGDWVFEESYSTKIRSIMFRSNVSFIYHYSEEAVMVV